MTRNLLFRKKILLPKLRSWTEKLRILRICRLKLSQRLQTISSKPKKIKFKGRKKTKS